MFAKKKKSPIGLFQSSHIGINLQISTDLFNLLILFNSLNLQVPFYEAEPIQ